jgi:hypothetical protein
MLKLLRLYQNRFGVYYLRLVRSGRETKRSLRTKDFRQTKLLALAFNLDPDALKRLDVVFPDGTQEKHQQR